MLVTRGLHYLWAEAQPPLGPDPTHYQPCPSTPPPPRNPLWATHTMLPFIPCMHRGRDSGRWEQMQAWPSMAVFPLILLLATTTPAPPGPPLPPQAEGRGGVGFAFTQGLVQVVKMQVETRLVRPSQVHRRHPRTLVGASPAQAEPPSYEGRSGFILLLHPIQFSRLLQAALCWTVLGTGSGAPVTAAKKALGIGKQRQAAGFLSGDCSPRPISC